MSDKKNIDAREKIKPLRDGERPRSVTASAVVAIALASSMVAPYIFGADSVWRVGPGVTLPLAVLLFIAAVGMWRVRYWALLGFQAYLALTIVALSLVLVIETSLLEAAVALALILVAGVLFWSLVKTMARIQLTERQRHGN